MNTCMVKNQTKVGGVGNFTTLRMQTLAIFNLRRFAGYYDVDHNI